MCLSLKWSGKPIKVPTFTRNTWRKPFPKRGLLSGLSVCRWTFRETSAMLAKFRLGSSKFHQMVLCILSAKWEMDCGSHRTKEVALT
jgi:hypothetical protein